MNRRQSKAYEKTYVSASPRPLPAEVTRKGLLSRITGASEASLFVLAAPSGYGKTTLLGQLARTSKHAVWLTLSKRHTDLAALADELMTSITSAVKEATFTRIRKAISEGAQVSALAVPIARELDDLEVNLRILVDQANLLGEGAVSWLESFALALGEGHQLSYGAYDLASERLAMPLASGRALLLTAPDLAFSEDESRAYLKARGSTQDAAAVQRALEGWPAGIGLAAAGLGNVVSQTDLLETAFARLPQNVREALPEASVFEVWREKDAEKLGCELPKGWLRAAQRSGLPLTPLSAQTYRPHTLVLERLEGELQDRPERYTKLHTLAGDSARKSKDLIAALQHYRKAGRLSEAFEIAEELIPQLHRRQEIKLICELLEPLSSLGSKLPSEVTIYYGTALFRTGQVERGEKILEKLWADNRGEPLTSIFLAGFYLEKNQIMKAYETISKTFEEIQEEYHLYIARRILVDILTNLKRYDEALSLAHNIMTQAEVIGDQLQVAGAFSSLEFIYFHTNDFEACEQAILKALRHLTNLKMRNSQAFLILSNNLADLYNVQGRFLDAFEVISESLARMESKYFIKRSNFLYRLACTLDALTKYDDAVLCHEESIKLSLEYKLLDRVKRTQYTLSKSTRRNGDSRRARETLNMAHQAWSDGDKDWTGEKEYYEGLDAFDNGDMLKAKQNFNNALLSLTLEDVDDISSHTYLLEIDRREGLLTLEKVEEFISRLDAFGQDSILHTDAEPKRPLYRELVARGWFAERFAPFTQPLPCNIVKPKRFVLEVQTFDGFHCNFEQNTVKLPFAKAAELLVWLTLHGPATREQIIDALWDGSSDPKHIEYAKLTLRRLRTTLAEHFPFNPLVYADRKYQLASELEVELDARDLLEAFETADLTARRDALERHNGTFLPGIHSEWVEQTRIRLQDAAFSTAVGLGKLYEASDVTSALWAYQKAVELEPLELDAHKALVQLLQSSGDEVGARRAYLTYTRVLKAEFGETPAYTFDEMMQSAKTNHLN